MGRAVSGGRKHRLRVHAEFIFPHKAMKPKEGNENLNRTCMPYPFQGELMAKEAAGVFELAVDGFKRITYFSPGGLLACMLAQFTPAWCK